VTKPSSVLFVCGRNSVRSPIAEALAEALFPDGLYVASAGVSPGDRDPFVDSVLAEIGLDLGGRRPHGLDDLEDLNFDLAVTLSPEAHHRVLELTRTQGIEVEYWPTPDPTITTGTREQIMASYRDLRERLSARIRERFGGAFP
jgi:protein-tyrosine-phosphatase